MGFLDSMKGFMEGLQEVGEKNIERHLRKLDDNELMDVYTKAGLKSNRIWEEKAEEELRRRGLL